jgi:AcrR family transcriptional regulator
LAYKTKNVREMPKPDRLIEVAGEIFARRGFSATVRDICREAECSVAAVNYYFGDKQSLYFRCVAAACERKERLFPLPVFSGPSPPAERLLRFIEVMTRRILTEKDTSWQNTLMLREVLSPTPGVEEMLRAHFRPGFRMLTELLGELLGPVNSLNLREQLTWQIVARCMFLRTGQHLHALLTDSARGEQSPMAIAEEICASILVQINSLIADSKPLISSNGMPSHGSAPVIATQTLESRDVPAQAMDTQASETAGT